MLNPTPATQNTAAVAPTATGAPQFASLYVGDLDPEVTEAMLYEIFNTVGPVASIRVCRDSVSRRSLGYAYVNFHSAADAERVMDTLNYSTIKGRCCRIMWSHRDPNLRKTGNGNVFVKNLDKNVDNKALYDTFSLFGNILSCKVATDPDGKSRGYGFVHYETAEAAKQAIDKVNGMQIGEKTVYVGEFIPRDGRAPTEVTNFTNIYVKNFPDEWDEDKIVEIFKEFGQITSQMVQKDKKGRGFAFLNYETTEQAKAAIDAYHGKDMRSEEEKKEFPDGPPQPKKEKKEGDEPKEGEEDEEHERILADDHPEHLMFVQRAMNRAEREQVLKAKFAKLQTNAPVGVNLYIKNLSDDVDDAALKEMFKPFGEITSARVMADGKSRSKGFGFVCYKTPDEATKAVTEMHLKTVKGKPLYVGLAEKKDERNSRLAARYKGGEKGGGKGLVTFGADGGKGMGMQMGGKGMPGQYPGQYPQQQMGMPGQPQMMMGKGMPNQMPGQMFPPQMMMNRQQPNMMMGGAQRPPMMPYPNPQMMQQQQMMMKGNPMMGGPQMGKGFDMGKGMQPQMQGKGVPQQQIRPQGPPQAGQQRQDGNLTAQMLANAPNGMQKQMLGEKLYPAVSRLQPELAGKITGMMLEMDNSELLLMLESEAQLRQKVDEAMRVLNQKA